MWKKDFYGRDCRDYVAFLKAVHDTLESSTPGGKLLNRWGVAFLPFYEQKFPMCSYLRQLCSYLHTTTADHIYHRRIRATWPTDEIKNCGTGIKLT